MSKNLTSPIRWVCDKDRRRGGLRRYWPLFDLKQEEIADIKRIAEGLQPDECRIYITSTGHEVMINPAERTPEDDAAKKGFVAYIADPTPVPGVFDCPEDALSAAREMLPDGNAIGHVVEVGTTDPASRRRLYCLTAGGAWREVR